ncbi:endonuclease Q family protein [Brevibacillus fluminis]|uniref:endonuclease Q family protein n=1 Tax=Brevibacillus fluminis TaxID=511487 RepID=UPI003F89D6F7
MCSTTLPAFFADLHIHLGSTMSGKPVKITASRKMTLSAVLEEASERKGIELIGIIDSHVPEVQQELRELMDRGQAIPLKEGGVRYKQTTLILGAEVEVKEAGRGEAHFLCYVPTLDAMQSFTGWLERRCRNVTLSSQRIDCTIVQLQEQVASLGGLVIPAHIFTPHKGLYGSCTDHMAEVANPALFAAVELGLSSNTQMADQISELHPFPFVTNSDAHSLAKIGREYQSIMMKEPNFHEWRLALSHAEGRMIAANYGLHPELGKYHQTSCQACGTPFPKEATERCAACGKKAVIRGVEERIRQLADLAPGIHPPHRPAYIEQFPLEFLPGIGPKRREQLYREFGTEMNILHRVGEADLSRVIGELATVIIRARAGELAVNAGGAGTYGKVKMGK